MPRQNNVYTSTTKTMSIHLRQKQCLYIYAKDNVYTSTPKPFQNNLSKPPLLIPFLQLENHKEQISIFHIRTQHLRLCVCVQLILTFRDNSIKELQNMDNLWPKAFVSIFGALFIEYCKSWLISTLCLYIGANF